MKELSHYIKEPNLRVMDIEEEEVEAKGIHNVFNTVVTQHFPNLKEVLAFKYRKPPGHQTNFTKIEPPHVILSLKQQTQRTEKGY
jgi:oligoribonuclease NrnB/cAMP/cGMP phosphodiesterase (DHH superfamily)